MSDEWRIPEDAEDWQCSWESARRFQLRYFRSLPMVEKILAVERMCRLARILGRRRALPTDEKTARDHRT